MAAEPVCLVNMLVANSFPLCIFWGTDLTQIYNDAYIQILGRKHPEALGIPCYDSWPEIKEHTQHLFDNVFQTGEPVVAEDFLYPVTRHGYLEEVYCTTAYSPLRVESGEVGGIIINISETTERVLSERRLRTLRDLGARTSEVRTPKEACRTAAEVLEENPDDLPFALLYLLNEEGTVARLTSTVGLERGTPAAPERVDFTAETEADAWPLASVARSGEAEQVADLRKRFGELPGGPWPEAPQTAVVQAFPSPTQEQPAGLLVLGISPRLALDDTYHEFLQLAADQVATAIADARAYQKEHRRAEALAELDRAKTTFFHNASHEFRTPLALLLGPLADVLNDEGDPLPPAHREALDTVHRNGRRLLKLVNNLMDFARVKAGRTEAVYARTDLSALTADLASTFRSAVERAGLNLVVDCPALEEPVYVDPEMWEKIVLNLLSNALKYTFEGEIEVCIRERENEGHQARASDDPKSRTQNPKSVVLQVRDTGIGIAEDELPHLFERFHRVGGDRARTDEGAGIGLALVEKLVRLHGGQVDVESTVGEGTTFTVTIPRGVSHLPAEVLPDESPRAARPPNPGSRRCRALRRGSPALAARFGNGERERRRADAWRPVGAHGAPD